MHFLNTAFGLTGQVTLGQEGARAVLIFVYGWLAVRALGRRVFGKWPALDIIVSIIIGSNLSRALTGNAPLWGTLAATSVMLLLHWGIAQAAARSRTLSRLLEGRPVRLIAEGRADAPKMQRWSISAADLEEAMRQRSFETIDQVREGLLEPSGAISLLR